MKKLSTLLLLLGAGIFTATAQKVEDAKPGLSAFTRHYLLAVQQHAQTQPQGYIYRTGDDGKRYISALIKVTDASKAGQSLKTIGALMGMKAGNIWAVEVPVDKVSQFTEAGGIAYIQLDEPVLPKLDIARKTTRVDSVHKGTGLPMVYSGKGVVVGVIDFGFDYNHPSFLDTPGTKFRIKKVWEMAGTGVHPAGFNYGRELADTNAIKAATTDNAVQTHGTCTTGMAAGSGYSYSTNVSANSKFRGMAYDADIVLVGVRRDSIAGEWLQGSFTDFANGVRYIMDYASSVSKPAVVNISWGSQSGSHDGTSLFNQACDNMSGPGKLIVMSAGNEGQEHIHLAKTFTVADTMISTNLTFTPATYQRTWVDIWGEAGKTFCGKATLYRNGSPVGAPSFVCLDNNTYTYNLIGSNGIDTCIVEYINTLADGNNGKPRMTINVYNKTTDTIRIDVKGTNGSVNMWNEYYYYGYDHSYQSAFSKLGQSWATEGDTISTVSDMGAAQSVLLVGAYVSKKQWADIGGNVWSYSATVGALAGFSSVGPMIDGRIKPDITAPGLTIATSCNSYDTSYSPTGNSDQLIRTSCTNPVTNRKYYYSEFSGTSAASPAAAGIVAILLQADPNLTPWDLKGILKETAIKDTYTGTLTTPANNWGSGKINAYGALKRVIQHLGVYNYSGSRKLDCVIFPNPGNGDYTLDYTGDKAETLRLQVIDITGKVVLKDLWTVAPGTSRRALDLNAFAKGTYIVHIAGRDGNVTIKTVLN